MATEREKEREAELEAVMYTNCLLLGLDPAVLAAGGGGGGAGGGAAGAGGWAPRVGLFKHSNVKLGEQLLYFLLSSLRGPTQSAKDFDKVWPIFDSGQQREFRKVAQNIISELESQGALPRNNSSRLSSLATCCGSRFVELLWQLSVHALREVHRRTFSADVAANPLPAALTEISYLHAASLIPVTKARIALERRKFLKNAGIAVQRQTAWSNLASEITAEYRSLCAEEAYLQQELEKLQDLRNKAKMEVELSEDRATSSSGQNSHLVSRASRLWESLLACRGQHEVLASGPIEDLIAHREHRYRISGSQLLAAMVSTSQSSHSGSSPARAGEVSPSVDQQGQSSSSCDRKDESLTVLDDRNLRVQPTVDVAEILRRWTHALQRIHKQSLYLAKANDGEGPELLRSASSEDANSHAESLAAALAEHRQHLVSIEGLINQLKEAIPAMQRSISGLIEEVNLVSNNSLNEMNMAALFSAHASNNGRQERADEVSDVTSKLSSIHLEKGGNSTALKIPHLFGLTSNLSVKGPQNSKSILLTGDTKQENIPDAKQPILPTKTDMAASTTPERDGYNANDIKRSVRKAALVKPASITEWPQEKSSDDGSEHFFIPINPAASTKEDSVMSWQNQRAAFSLPHSQYPNDTRELYFNDETPLGTVKVQSNGLSGLKPFSVDDSLDNVFSPPLLLDSSLFQDAYEDLLAPLSDADAALIEH